MYVGVPFCILGTCLHALLLLWVLLHSTWAGFCLVLQLRGDCAWKGKADSLLPLHSEQREYVPLLPLVSVKVTLCRKEEKSTTWKDARPLGFEACKQDRREEEEEEEEDLHGWTRLYGWGWDWPVVKNSVDMIDFLQVPNRYTFTSVHLREQKEERNTGFLVKHKLGAQVGDDLKFRSPRGTYHHHGLLRRDIYDP